MNFSVFGLGNTQYEHFNKTGIDIDALLEKLGGRRIYKLGLGDDNCSLEDDFTEWRKDLWKKLKEFRKNNPLREAGLEDKPMRKKSNEGQEESHAFLSKLEPALANYRLFLKKSHEEEYPWHQDDLDFKTKASLKAELAEVRSVRQLRQDEKDGSTLELEVELPGQPEYQTAGNVALYSKNDPAIVQEVVEYFHLPQNALEGKLGLVKLKEDKKIKLNFVPSTIKGLLEESVDLQGKLSKSVLKKLAKFPSINPEYFSENSLKTTKEFERITD
jgi:NADPH-ferrihemoprotein reductase